MTAGDHIHYAVARPAPDGSAGAGARFHIVEAFGADPAFLVERPLHLIEPERP